MTDNKYMTATTTTATTAAAAREAAYAITGNDRWNKGNTSDRAARRANLLRHWGNGTSCACVWCGLTLVDRGAAASGAGLADHLTVDHIVTHNDGGRYVVKNLVPACTRCNKSRGATPFEDYAAARGVDAAALRAHAAAYRRRSA